MYMYHGADRGVRNVNPRVRPKSTIVARRPSPSILASLTTKATQIGPEPPTRDS